MKFTCTQQNFLQGVSITEKIIGKIFSLPILYNILINCEKNTGCVKFSSTDLEIGIEVIVPAKIEEEGSITVPAKLLNNFIRNLPEENVEFSEKDKKVTIQCKNYKSNIKGEDAKEFPLIPDIKEDNVFTVKKDTFFTGISSVINTTSLLDIKPEISGVYIQFCEDNTLFTATDSFRLSEKIIKNHKKNPTPNNVILPHRACDIALRIFQNINNLFNIQINENQIIIKNIQENTATPKIKFVSRVINGEYPDYEQIIPNNFSTLVKIPRDELIQHIKTASLFSNKIKEIIFQIDSQKQKIDILAEDQERGDHHSVIPCKIEKSEGKEEKVIFNFQYLLDGVQQVSTPMVLIKLNQPTTPVLISSTENDGFRYVLMPIKA